MTPEEFYTIPPPQVTKQQLYDVVSTHLLRQGRRATAPNFAGGVVVDHSVYKSADGCKCAIGVCIRPSAYKRELEYVQPCELLKELGFSDSLRPLAFSLQLLHDTVEDVGEWPEHLRQIAKEHKLKHV